jgi:transcriptional repressor NrdR
MEILNLTVIKRDGRREPYIKEKLSQGLKKALEKRPYTADDFKKLITRIEREIQKKKQDEITSPEIGEIVIKILKKFDKVAYIRFASVYRSFEDVQTFQRELNLLLRRPSRTRKTAKPSRGRGGKRKKSKKL